VKERHHPLGSEHPCKESAVACSLGLVDRGAGVIDGGLMISGVPAVLSEHRLDLSGQPVMITHARQPFLQQAGGELEVVAPQPGELLECACAERSFR
jgi:hypothetical protein